MLVSKRKRYLSGSDWVLNTLDYMMKSTVCSGNVCQLVVILNSHLNGETLKTCLNRFVKKFPVLQGKLARDFKLTPYWKIPVAMDQDVLLNISEIPESSSLLHELLLNANRPFPDDCVYLDFHLFMSEGRSALAMRFDHRLFDARGAESFLSLFQKTLEDDSVACDITFTSSMELTEWKRKFLAGRTVNRRIIALSKSPPKYLPLKADSGKGFNFRLLSFDKQETSEIYDRAYRQAGYLMESPFFLAAITGGVHDLFAGKSESGSSYLIPVTVDLRPGKDLLQEIFFNHVSYLFYQIPVELGTDMEGLIALFKQQMYDQVKSGFPKDLAEASLLTRIAPLPMLGKLLYMPVNGKMATFAYSHLGRSSFQSNELMRSVVENIFHMPRVPTPPGLGFFSNIYNDRLNLAISCLEGLLSDKELQILESGIRRRLGVLPP